jgi:putative hydroxymethylpyrimidine transport system ATP-binding protein
MQQKDLLLPWLSLMQNAMLPQVFSKEKHLRKNKKAKGLFERFGLNGFEDYLPGAVSGGMKQRCALIRTLMFEREIVLLDEPLSALDAITRRSLQSLLLSLQKDFKKTVLMITHDIDEALYLADTVLVLTQAPMKIRDRITLPSEKPRNLDSSEYIAIKKRILSELEEEMQL